jgi:hypothetical protein
MSKTGRKWGLWNRLRAEIAKREFVTRRDVEHLCPWKTAGANLRELWKRGELELVRKQRVEINGWGTSMNVYRPTNKLKAKVKT